MKTFLRNTLTALMLLISWSLVAQPTGYYNAADGLEGNALKSALHNIIKNHSSQSYSSLWDHFEVTDAKTNGKVWDMYSDKPNGSPAYQFTFGSDQCGNYSTEGDCYNREHSWPKSWFNDHSPMYSDLFHLYPTDGKVNGMRSNYPFGEVNNPTWTSTNGSKLGPCSTAGYSGTVFEPIDEYKGDFARSYFYMSVRYYSEDDSWSSSGMTNGATIKPWAIAMLLRWHEDDPVSQKEINRNNAVYNIQHNRNPFIDNPEYAQLIWVDGYVNVDEYDAQINTLVWPNPVENASQINVSWNENVHVEAIVIYDLSGRTLLNVPIYETGRTQISLPSELASGFYMISLKQEGKNISTTKLFVR